MAEHNVDVSKLQLTTQEHSDTTNTFTLMHKEIEQLRVDKYVKYCNSYIYAYLFCCIVHFVLCGQILCQISCTNL